MSSSIDLPLERENGRPVKPLNPWIPEKAPLRMAVLGKLAEELAECSAIVARCMIQGIDECEPVTGKNNRKALEDELADVRATVQDAIDFFGLDTGRIYDREGQKLEHLHRWHELLIAIGKGLDPAGRANAREK